MKEILTKVDYFWRCCVFAKDIFVYKSELYLLLLCLCKRNPCLQKWINFVIVVSLQKKSLFTKVD